MILSITEAAKRFKISRSKLYRMSDSGKISFSKKSDGSLGIDVSELTRVFGDTSSEHVIATKQDRQKHDFETENLYLKREIETLTQNLQKSEARLDQFITLTQEQAKQLFLTSSPQPTSFWHRLWRK